MAEKKTTKVAAEKKVPATKKATTTKKATAAKTTKCVKAATVAINVENVGFKAGDVYQALAASEKALSAKEIAKKANISETEVYLGLGWLFKEGKIVGDNELIALA